VVAKVWKRNFNANRDIGSEEKLNAVEVKNMLKSPVSY
jgi:hypothetical protein